MVGVTRRNIRFYEKEGLLTPSRDSQNGYREYGQTEVMELKRIKLLRKLGLPLDEIRRMQTEGGTVADGIRRHLITLEREQQDIAQSITLCEKLKGVECRLAAFDADVWLKEMSEMEKKGTTFSDKQRTDVKRKSLVAPVLASVVMIVLMAGIILLMAWAFAVDPEGAPPVALAVFLFAIPAAVILGTVLALIQRCKELLRGEAEEARKY